MVLELLVLLKLEQRQLALELDMELYDMDMLELKDGIWLWIFGSINSFYFFFLVSLRSGMDSKARLHEGMALIR